MRLRLVQPLGYGDAGRVAVVAVGIQRHLRHGVHRIGSDQWINVHRVGVGWVFGAGACPQHALDARALIAQCLETRLGEDFDKAGVGQFAVGDRSFGQQPVQHFLDIRVVGRGDERLDALVGVAVDATYEEACHRRYFAQVAAAGSEPLQTANVGAGGLLVGALGK